MITRNSGLYAEIIRGRHILLTQQAVSSTDIISACLAFPHYRVVYSVSDIEAQKVIWGAIKCLMLNKNAEITPLCLPQLLKGYSEFIFHTSHGYRFIDFNDNPLIAKLPFPNVVQDILP